MVSPSQKRSGVSMLKEKGISERKSCQLIGIHRKTARYVPKSDPVNKQLSEKLRCVASRHFSYGYRFAHQKLIDEGLCYNHKRIERLWSQEGLALKNVRRRLRRKYGISKTPVKVAEHPNHVWSYDFVHDKTINGRKLKILTIIDEYTRECLAIKVDKRISSHSVKACLEWLFLTRGVPAHIRSDNGPEFIAKDLNLWFGKVSLKPIFIKPGSPWENAYVERFNGTLRKELLNAYAFTNGPEAQQACDNYRGEYNNHRPHSSLGYLTPVKFAEQSAKKQLKYSERDFDFRFLKDQKPKSLLQPTMEIEV